jgi:hypothetical protein
MVSFVERASWLRMLGKGYPALGGEGHVCFVYLSSVYQYARLFVFPFCHLFCYGVVKDFWGAILE